MAKKTGGNLKLFIFFIITAIVVLIGRFDVFSFVRTPFAFVYDPVAYVAFEGGKGVGSWGKALSNVSSYIYEFEECKDELVELKSYEESMRILIEENDALRAQIGLSNKESVYSLGKVIKYYDEGLVSLNIGSNDGVGEDDVVVAGNIFMGVVVEVDLNSCMVKLPVNKSSSYEVGVFSNDLDLEERLSRDTQVKSRAVVTGGVDGIRVENININSNVKDGDLVVIRDERIGELLVLGRLVSLEDNPASTSKSGYVSPVYDYANLITVFVKTN